MKNKWIVLFLLTLTVIFKDITQYDLVRSVLLTIQQTKMVDAFAMKRAKRGLIEYEGNLNASEKDFQEMLSTSVRDKLNIEATQKETGLEIVLTKKAP